MAKGKQSAKKAGRGRAPAPDSPLPSDLEDEVDKFHKQRDKLALNLEDDRVSEDSLDEEEVLGLEDSEEYDTDDEIEAETKYGKRECASRGMPYMQRGLGGWCGPWATRSGPAGANAQRMQPAAGPMALGRLARQRLCRLPARLLRPGAFAASLPPAWCSSCRMSSDRAQEVLLWHC